MEIIGKEPRHLAGGRGSTGIGGGKEVPAAENKAQHDAGQGQNPREQSWSPLFCPFHDLEHPSTDFTFCRLVWQDLPKKVKARQSRALIQMSPQK
jgi:hypothetical protein